MRILLLIVFIILSIQNCVSPPPEKQTCELQIIPRNHFDRPKNAKDSYRILLNSYSDLLNSIKKKDASKYLNYIHPEKGILLEYKAHWDLKEVKDEISKSNSYFEKTYYCKDCLSESLNEVCTIELDFIWLSQTNVSIQTHFHNHPEWDDRILVTNWFEEKGKWFINQGF